MLWKKAAKSLSYKRPHWEEGGRSWSALKIQRGRSHPCLVWMQDLTPLRNERPWDFSSFWGVLRSSYLNKWLCPHDLQCAQPHDKGLWNNFFLFPGAGWNMGCTEAGSRLEFPGWDLALTLSARSGGLTSPTHHFLCFQHPGKGLFADLQEFQIDRISKYQEFNSAFSCPLIHPSRSHLHSHR